MTKKLTPAMAQYMRFKERHPDAILLFRMGDFYETFYDDAVVASQLLGLTLTARNNGRGGSNIPLAGVPHHALDAYLARLIRAGKKVAICEQMEPPQKGKKVVHREVVQVVSPGTVLSDELLDQKRNNYLVGIFVAGDQLGMAVTDLSTGMFKASERTADDLWETLARMGPAEVLAPESWAKDNEAEFKAQVPGALLTQLEDWHFEYRYAYDALKAHFKVASLKGFGCDDLTVGVRAAGGVLCYLHENQKGAVSHMTRLARERTESAMELDLVTQRNLELISTIQDGRREGTLFGVLDKTCTPPGARTLRAWLSQPLLAVPRIEARLDAVQALVESPADRDDARTALRRVGDLERLMSKICCNRANPRELVALRRSLEAVVPLRKALRVFRADLLVRARDHGMPDLTELIDVIAHTLEDDPPAQTADGGYIRTGYHAELDELRTISSGGRDWVANLQADEREKTGIASLKVGYNKAFGYYIEVTKVNQDKVPAYFVRKQTLVNAERYITPELKDWEAKILGADERAKDLERDLFAALREKVAEWVEPVQRTALSVATVDVLSALAEVASANDYARPRVDEGVRIDIAEGRHPAVEQLLPGGQFVPNDLTMDGESDQILLITGPNMSGKSTILRQAGLIVLLAQIGSFVPARQARIGVVDRIFTRVGASDNLARGESTFLVEMNEAANILNNATPKSLVLLDEIGRGTSTFDGLSIAWAMTEHLHNAERLRPRTLFATHYHELTELEDLLPRVKNYSVAVREAGDTIAFLHRLVPGGCDHSYGIEVARLAGMPAEMIARAKEILNRLEQNDLSVGAKQGQNGSPSGSQPSRDDDDRADLPAESKPTGPDAQPSRYNAQNDRPEGSDRVQENGQIPLFAPATDVRVELKDHPMLSELRDLDVAHLTPIEALVKLDAWKRALTRGEPKE